MMVAIGKFQSFRWKAQQLGLQPLVYVRGFASAGVDPKIMGISASTSFTYLEVQDT